MGETDHQGGPRRARRRACASGLIHNVGADDAAALDLVRAVPALLPVVGVVVPAPTCAAATTAPLGAGDPRPRAPQRPAGLRHAPGGRRASSTRAPAFEVQPTFGTSVITYLARLGGHPVAVVANQPMVLAGSIDADGADKARPLHQRGRLVPPAARLPRPTTRASCRAAPRSSRRSSAGARMYAAQSRRPTPKFDGDAAQGLRLRLDGHGHDPVRRPVRGVHLSRA